MTTRRSVDMILLACLVVFTFVIAGVGLSALGRGELSNFGTRFDLQEAQGYVALVRTEADPLNFNGHVRDLPAELAHLSVGGKVEVGGDRATGQLFVRFFMRRGMQSNDVYFYVEGPKAFVAYYPEEAGNLEPIAPGWYHLANVE